MPLLYGERWKAFQRLQLLIMEQHEDESIFTWSEQSTDAADSAFHGLLAKRPSQFAHCGNVVAMRTDQDLKANARNVELCGGLLRAAREEDDSQEVFLHQIRCAYTSNPASYLDVYVSDNVIGDDAIRPCFITLSLKSNGDLFSRVRARQLPWTLATHQESLVLACQPKQFFRARTSFSVEAIIDRVFSGSTPDVERESGRESNAPFHARPTIDRSGPINHSYIPTGDIQNARDPEFRSPLDLQQPSGSYYPPSLYAYNYPPSPYAPFTNGDGAYGYGAYGSGTYGLPPTTPPRRPNARSAALNPRNASTTHSGQSRKLDYFFNQTLGPVPGCLATASSSSVQAVG
ncbi:hypothetical protein PRZ48_006262 [Zasmidium cellare]|uniref:Uncharacterized protein n=1 Tax=Zasmidium cellare TaxID=395010 RepID=A0ABR0ENW7_ZASCE|nr:hypothetical protein PRZ48_006262 [Zasmidium cellare]